MFKRFYDGAPLAGTLDDPQRTTLRSNLLRTLLESIGKEGSHVED